MPVVDAMRRVASRMASSEAEAASPPVSRTVGLGDDDAGCAPAGPTPVPHFLKRFPHADDTFTAARRVDDRVRQVPIELLGELDRERLVAFDPVRFAQGRDVEEAAFLREFT